MDMDNLKQSMEQMQNFFVTQMDQFRSQMQGNASSVSTPSLEVRFTAFQNLVMNMLQSLQDQVDLLSRSTDNIEMRSRKKFLLFHGIPENNGEDPAAVITQTVQERLNLNELSLDNISRCHRMGRPLAGKPRPVLVKVRDWSIRNKVWSAKSKLKGTGVTLSEFLTKSRHDVFMAARKRFGVANCWTREGTVYVLDTEGARHRVECLSDLDKVVAEPEQAGTKPPRVVPEPSVAAAPTTRTRKTAAAAASKSGKM
ncbi:uncharacterized protein LOC132903586 [Amyelois transitella]|uniref:uncharacterized protein LOC106130730 n=1 Tax=Amyelois transitella TaxID=680683 RepID=UPI00067DF159|nr:uncharacterized protein LOC106130730 [Amyelois transitella]XP_060808160.1 uncharacterized protein LOC132903586 [Amyelois transitella]